MKDSNLGSCRLVSPVQRRTAGSCVHFFYYTTGSNDNQLNLYAKTSTNLGSPIWSVSGPTGNM